MHSRVALGLVVTALAFGGCKRTPPAPSASVPPEVAAPAAVTGPGKGALPLHISHGAPVNLAAYAVPGKITVFDFYSEYCPPCRAIAPHLDALHHARADIAVVKIDINREGHRGIDWESPVAAQHHLHQVPTFVVFGPDGHQQSEGDEAYHQVVSWIEASEKM